MKPTFIARFLRDGATALQCRETGAHYVVGQFAHRPYDCGAYRNGQLFMTGPRAACVNAVESDAR
jgi:hypothetical protein